MEGEEGGERGGGGGGISITFRRTLEHSNAYISQSIKYKTRVSTDSKSR